MSTPLKPIRYSDGEVELAGLAATPQGTPRAAVAVFPTFINSTPGVEAKATKLVDRGYAVLIADFYGDNPPTTQEEAFAAMTALRADPQVFRQRLRATISQLAQMFPGMPQLAIGYCLGGMSVLEMARDGQDLLAVASFHGILETSIPAEAPIKPRMLVCHGDADSLVPRGQVTGFWEEMDKVQADWHFHSYRGVEHGFTQQLTGIGEPNANYDASADRQSWAAMLSFFDEVLD